MKQRKTSAPKAPAGAKRGLPAAAKRPRQIPSTTTTRGFEASSARKFTKLSEG